MVVRGHVGSVVDIGLLEIVSKRSVEENTRISHDSVALRSVPQLQFVSIRREELLMTR